MDIGKRMKELRIQYGLTQQELADRSEHDQGNLFPSWNATRTLRPSAHCLTSYNVSAQLLPNFLRTKNRNRSYLKKMIILKKSAKMEIK